MWTFVCCMLWVVACVVVGKILYHQSTNLDCLLLLTFGFEFGEDGLQGPRGTRGFFTQGKDGQSSFTGWVKASLLQHFDPKKKLLQNFLKPFANAWNLHVIKECQFWLSTYVMMMLFINLPLGSCDDDALHQPSIRTDHASD